MRNPKGAYHSLQKVAQSLDEGMVNFGGGIGMPKFGAVGGIGGPHSPMRKLASIGARQKLKAASITTLEEAIGAARSAPGDLAKVLDAQTVEQLRSDQFLSAAAEQFPALRRFRELEAKKLRFGARLGHPPGYRAERVSTETKSALVVPPSEINLIDQPCMPPIRDQGSRWTCVAFATCAVVEFAFCRRQNVTLDGAEQFQYWDTKRNDPDGYTSLGTWPEISFDRMMKAGVCREQTWSYHPTIDPPQNDPAGPRAEPEASNYKVRQSVMLSDPRDVTALKNRLTVEGPIAVAIPVFDSWAENPAVADSGNIGMPLDGETSQYGHALVLVGFANDDEFPGGGYFIIRNSYGTGWGAQCPFGRGYGTIPFRYLAEQNFSAFFVRL